MRNLEAALGRDGLLNKLNDQLRNQGLKESLGVFQTKPNTQNWKLGNTEIGIIVASAFLGTCFMGAAVRYILKSDKIVDSKMTETASGGLVFPRSESSGSELTTNCNQLPPSSPVERGPPVHAQGSSPYPSASELSHIDIIVETSPPRYEISATTLFAPVAAMQAAQEAERRLRELQEKYSPSDISLPSCNSQGVVVEPAAAGYVIYDCMCGPICILVRPCGHTVDDVDAPIVKFRSLAAFFFPVMMV